MQFLGRQEGYFIADVSLQVCREDSQAAPIAAPQSTNLPCHSLRCTRGRSEQTPTLCSKPLLQLFPTLSIPLTNSGGYKGKNLSKSTIFRRIFRKDDLFMVLPVFPAHFQSVADTGQPGWVLSISSSRTEFLKTNPTSSNLDILLSLCLSFPIQLWSCFPGIWDCQRCSVNLAGLPTPPSSTPSERVFQRLPKDKTLSSQPEPFLSPAILASK